MILSAQGVFGELLGRVRKRTHVGLLSLSTALDPGGNIDTSHVLPAEGRLLKLRFDGWRPPGRTVRQPYFCGIPCVLYLYAVCKQQRRVPAAPGCGVWKPSGQWTFVDFESIKTARLIHFISGPLLGRFLIYVQITAPQLAKRVQGASGLQLGVGGSFKWCRERGRTPPIGYVVPRPRHAIAQRHDRQPDHRTSRATVRLNRFRLP